jgi:hypothetical protein
MLLTCSVLTTKNFFLVALRFGNVHRLVKYPAGLLDISY